MAFAIFTGHYFATIMNNLSVTTIQTNLHWENKNANLQMLENKINTLPQGEIVVLPEMFSTGFSMKPEELAETMDGPTMQWMKAIAISKKVILTGSIIVKEDNRFFNRLIWMLPNRTYGYYDKRHLFAYAGEHNHYTQGEKRLVAQVNGWRILLLICYDLRFPIWSRQQIKNDAAEFDAIIYVANWPDRRSAAWCALLQARAIENQCYVIGVNRVGDDGNGIYHSGYTSVIDPLGEIIYREKDKEAIANHLLDAKQLEDIRLKLPFWKDGDRFTIQG
jgi:predicted amidohydrolase